MRFRNLNIGLVVGVVAVVLQTTVFDRYVDPFGVAPDFVLLVVVAASYQLSEEAAMLLASAPACFPTCLETRSSASGRSC